MLPNPHDTHKEHQAICTPHDTLVSWPSRYLIRNKNRFVRWQLEYQRWLDRHHGACSRLSSPKSKSPPRRPSRAERAVRSGEKGRDRRTGGSGGFHRRPCPRWQLWLPCTRLGSETGVVGDGGPMRSTARSGRQRVVEGGEGGGRATDERSIPE